METVVSILIPAIVENVFGALAEAVGLSDWLRQRLGRDPEKLAFHQALTQALTDSASHYPGRDLRYFAEILRDIGGPLLARTLQPAAPLPTADELTAVWLNHLTVDSLIHYRVEFTQFVTHFLDRLQFHLENQQPLRWIAQARHERNNEEAMRRMVDATEQSATNIEALRQEIARLTAALATVLQTSSGSTATTEGGSYNAGTISAQNFAGRDLTINQYFVQGLARLVFNYSARIENFLFEYLGGQGQRVPFGGRKTQIDQLNTWLDDPGAPPYLLMVAEAGGGKSALVTRWSAQLTTRTDLEVIFVPISIRFQTAAQDVAFASLAARLAQIYEQQSTLPAALSAEQWKGQCETYLRLPLPAGKRLLVIIDGLDEATGWEAGPELFAKRPPAGLRILVTARTRAKEIDADRWAVRLGWQNDQIARKLHLPGLDHHGIAEALVSMGNPLDHLATQVDLVSELHRLSKGDPLVVRLYVEALQEMGAAAARLRPEDLADIEPGLDGFMERWWADQRKQWQMQGKDPFTEEERLLPFIHACTIACGPLLLNDLAELDKQHFGKGLLVTHMAELLGRWIIGDGKKQGYVFNHPRLRNYFSERLTPDEEREWQDKFCNWGKRVLTALNTGAFDPKQTPEYLLRYYSTHLERSHAPAEAFYALLNNGWRRAWELVDISYGGFLNDVDLVWDKAMQAYAANLSSCAVTLVQQVRAALCQASIAALNSTITPELFAQLVAAKLRTATQALAVIKLMPDKKKQSEMLLAIISHLPSVWLEEALNITGTIRDEGTRVSVLCAIASRLPETKRLQLLEEALDVAHTIKYDSSKVSVLSAIASHLPKDKQIQVLEEALHIVLCIEDIYNPVSTLRKIAPHLPTKLVEDALSIVRTIWDSYSRADALRVLALQLPENKQLQILEEALDLAYTTGDIYFIVSVKSVLALHLPESERTQILEDTLDFVLRFKEEYNPIPNLSKLVPHLPHTLIEKTLVTIRIAWGDSLYASALREVAPYLSDVLIEEAFNVTCVISEQFRTSALLALAPYLPIRFIQKALDVAYSIRSKDDRISVLCALSVHLPDNDRVKLLEEMVGIVYTIEDKYHCISMLGTLASHLPLSLQKELLDAARESGNERLLTALAPYLPYELLMEALDIVQSINNKASRSAALCVFIPYLPLTLLEEALGIANAIKSVTALRMIAQYLSEDRRIQVLDEALAVARSIEDKYSRAYALSDLAPYLPESKREQVLQEASGVTRIIMPGFDPRSTMFLSAISLKDKLGGACRVEHEGYRNHALIELVPHLLVSASQQPQQSYLIFTEALSLLAVYPRPAFLDDLAALMPFILALAGDEAPQAAEGIYHAIQEVCEWWP